MQFENSLQFRGEQEIPTLQSQRASSLLFLHRILQCWYLGCTSSPQKEPRFNGTVCSGKIGVAGTGHRSTGQTAFGQVGGLAACKAVLSLLCAPQRASGKGAAQCQELGIVCSAAEGGPAGAAEAAEEEDARPVTGWSTAQYFKWV